MIVTHSAMSAKRLNSLGITCLNGDSPMVESHGTQEENTFPALDWEYFSVRNFYRRCSELEDWFDEKLCYSKYSSVPVGNLKHDNESHIIDVLFSRALSNSKHLLWYSDTNLPDLGGNEDAHFRRFLFDQLDSNLEITQPGFYRSYCVEIDISLLCFNAIMQCENLHEFPTMAASNKKLDEKEKEYIDYQNNLSETIESPEACIPVFIKLKTVLSQWTEDVKRGNVYADILIQHVYRWLSDPESKLYDPQLFHFVSFLMKK